MCRNAKGCVGADMPSCTYCHRSAAGIVCRYCLERHEAFWRETCPGVYRTTEIPKLAELTGIASATFDGIMAHPLGPQGLVITGAPGCGKSRILWKLMRRRFDFGQRILAFNLASPAATFSLQVAQHYRDGDAAEWIELLESADVLWWDDMDKDKLTDRAEETAFALVEHFCTAGKPIFATMNVNGEELTAQMAGQSGAGQRGAAIVRRIREFSKSMRLVKPVKGVAK